jgi:outer membrane protein TolC
MKLKIFSCLFLCVWSIQVNAQFNELTLQQAIQKATLGNPNVKLSDLKITREESFKLASMNISSPEILFEAPTGDELRPGVLQTFDFPIQYVRRFQAQGKLAELSEAEKLQVLNELRYQVRLAYNELQYLKEVEVAYIQQDSLLSDFLKVTEVRLSVGQISPIERMNALSQSKEIEYQLNQIRSKERRALLDLSLLLGTPGDTTWLVSDAFKALQVPEIINLNMMNNPQVLIGKKNLELSEARWKAERSGWMPGLVIGYLNQSDAETEARYRMRYGFSVPLWFFSQNSRVKTAKTEIQIAQQQQVTTDFTLNGRMNDAISSLKQYSEALNYYQNTGLGMAADITTMAKEAYRIGSIGYYNYLLNLQQVEKIRLGYLEALRNFNQSIFTIQLLKAE